MTRPDFLKSLAVSALLTALTAWVTYVVMGAQLFSFYGWAAAGLFGAIALSRTLRKRFTAQGISRWPRLVFLVPAVLACLIQIGYWLAFFEGGARTVILGPARLQFLHSFGHMIIPALLLLMAVASTLIIRGLRP